VLIACYKLDIFNIKVYIKIKTFNKYYLMKALHTHLDKNARLLIPYQIRNLMGLKSGDSFIVNANSGSLVDEFLEQKYQEAKKENSKF